MRLAPAPRNVRVGSKVDVQGEHPNCRDIKLVFNPFEI
jgi:hypothetical protein